MREHLDDAKSSVLWCALWARLAICWWAWGTCLFLGAVSLASGAWMVLPVNLGFAELFWQGIKRLEEQVSRTGRPASIPGFDRVRAALAARLQSTPRKLESVPDPS